MIGRGWMAMVAGLGLAGCGSVVPSKRLPEQALDPVQGAGNLAATAFRATAVATVRQPATSVRTGLYLTWARSREVVVGNVPVSVEPAEPPSDPPGSDGFERMLDREGLPAAQPGTVRCLVDGPRFFREFDRLLEGAERSVDLQMFIFDNDDIACRYADRLRRLSERRRVRVMFDDLGSTWAAVAAPDTPPPGDFEPVPDIGRYLRDGSAVKVRRTLNPWLVADHTKLIVVDDRVALLGGMNIGREYYSEWHDLMVRVEGPVVKTMAEDFERTWRRAGSWGDFAWVLPERRMPEVDWPSSAGRVRVLRTDAAHGTVDIFKAHVAAIRASRKRVWIETPYFGSDEIVRAATAAAGRGVDVRVVLPGRNDSAVMHSNHQATARELIDAGARVYRYPGMTHLKAMLCDDWVLLGSANLDTLSMRINRELNIAFREPRAVRQVRVEVFEADFRKSRLVRRDDTESPVAPLAESIADQL